MRWMDGQSIDMSGLLRGFQAFWRDHSEAWRERFDYKEAGAPDPSGVSATGDNGGRKSRASLPPAAGASMCASSMPQTVSARAKIGEERENPRGGFSS